LADEWFTIVNEWQHQNAHLKKEGMPDANDEYFIYQTITGTYPLPGTEENNFSSRIQEYIRKALREAKVHSSWTKSDEAYEYASQSFALALLEKDKPFWNKFETFYKKIVDHGIVNSLTQVVLKFTCPGVPDTFQGGEL